MLTNAFPNAPNDSSLGQAEGDRRCYLS
jgi:hypothetical protein